MCSGGEIGLIASGLEQCGWVATHAWMDHQGTLLAEQMNLSSCRIYLPSETAAKLTEHTDSTASAVPHPCLHRLLLYGTRAPCPLLALRDAVGLDA